MANIFSMGDPDESPRDGLDRRDVLRSLTTGTVTAPLLLSGCSMLDPSSSSDDSDDPSSSSDDSDDPGGRTAVADDCGGPAGGATTITVDGSDYEVPVKGIRVPGTCEDLQAVVNQGGIDPSSSPVEYDPENPPHALRPDNFDTWESPDTPDTGDSGPDLVPAWDCGDSETGGGDGEGDKTGDAEGEPVGKTPTDWIINGLDVNGDELSWVFLDRSGPAELTNQAELTNRVDTNHRITGLGKDQDGDLTYERSPLNDSIELEKSELGPDSQYDYEKSIKDIDVDFDFEPVIVLPDWHPSHAVSEECKRRYCQNLRAVFEHERVHARNAIETALEFADGFDFDEPPTVKYSEGTDEAKVDRMLYREGNARIYETLRQAVCEKRRKDTQFHKDEREEINFFTFCEACTQCEAHDYRSYSDVESWRMQVSYFYRMRDTAPNTRGGVTLVESKGAFLGQFELTRADVPLNEMLEWAGIGEATGWRYERDLHWDGDGSLYSCEVYENRDRFAGDDFVEAYERMNLGCEGLARLAIDYQTEEQYQVQLPKCWSMGYNENHCIERSGGALASPLPSGRRAMLNSESLVRSDPDFDWPRADWASIEKPSPVFTIEECPWILTKEFNQLLKKNREVDGTESNRLSVGPHLDGETVGAEQLQLNLVPRVREDDECNHIDCL